MNTIAVQGDGKILIGGFFTSVDNGRPRGRVARLNSDGSLDTAFMATGAGANNGVFALAVQTDGMILIGGAFTAFNGVDQGHIARIWF